MGPENNIKQRSPDYSNYRWSRKEELHSCLENPNELAKRSTSTQASPLLSSIEPNKSALGIFISETIEMIKGAGDAGIGILSFPRHYFQRATGTTRYFGEDRPWSEIGQAYRQSESNLENELLFIPRVLHATIIDPAMAIFFGGIDTITGRSLYRLNQYTKDIPYFPYFPYTSPPASTTREMSRDGIVAGLTLVGAHSAIGVIRGETLPSPQIVVENAKEVAPPPLAPIEVLDLIEFAKTGKSIDLSEFPPEVIQKVLNHLEQKSLLQDPSPPSPAPASFPTSIPGRGTAALSQGGEGLSAQAIPETAPMCIDPQTITVPPSSLQALTDIQTGGVLGLGPKLIQITPLTRFVSLSPGLSAKWGGLCLLEQRRKIEAPSAFPFILWNDPEKEEPISEPADPNPLRMELGSKKKSATIGDPEAGALDFYGDPESFSEENQTQKKLKDLLKEEGLKEIQTAQTILATVPPSNQKVEERNRIKAEEDEVDSTGGTLGPLTGILRELHSVTRSAQGELYLRIRELYLKIKKIKDEDRKITANRELKDLRRKWQKEQITIIQDPTVTQEAKEWATQALIGSIAYYIRRRVIWALHKKEQENKREDLIQEILLVLRRTIVRFDPDRALYITYAAGHMRFTRRYRLYQRVPLPIEIPLRAKPFDRVLATRHRLRELLGKEPTIKEISEYAKVPYEETFNIFSSLDNENIVNLNSSTHRGLFRANLREEAPDEEGFFPQERAIADLQFRNRLTQAYKEFIIEKEKEIEKITDANKQRVIRVEIELLRLRWLIQEDKDPLTLREIGEKYNVSRARIGEIETNLMKKLKAYLTEKNLAP